MHQNVCISGKALLGTSSTSASSGQSLLGVYGPIKAYHYPAILVHFQVGGQHWHPPTDDIVSHFEHALQPTA
jgi:hypothetical protein